MVAVELAAVMTVASAHRNSVYDRNPITGIAAEPRAGRGRKMGMGEDWERQGQNGSSLRGSFYTWRDAESSCEGRIAEFLFLSLLKK